MASRGQSMVRWRRGGTHLDGASCARLRLAADEASAPQRVRLRGGEPGFGWRLHAAVSATDTIAQRGRRARAEGVAVEWKPGWKPEVLASGLEFPEGPISLGGGEVVFTQIRGQRLSRYSNGVVTTLAVTGGGANGATLGPGGDFFVANNGGLSTGPHGQWLAPEQLAGRIQRVSAAGVLSDVAVELPGAPPHRPNDLCF